MQAGGARAEMTGVASSENGGRKQRKEDRLGLELVKRGAKAIEVSGADGDREIDVSGELRGPVQDAGLPAHQQRLHPVALESRKDSGNRALAHSFLPGAGTLPRGAGTL